MNTVLGYWADTRSAGPWNSKPWREDEIVPLGGVGAEGLVLFRRGSGLDMADGQPERVVDALKAGVGAGVPGGVSHAAGGDEADPNAAALLAAPRAAQKRQQSNTGKPV